MSNTTNSIDKNQWNINTRQNTIDKAKSFRALVKSKGTLSIDAIANQIAKERSEFRPETVSSVVRLFEKIVRESVCEGFSVKTDNYLLAPKIKGKLEDAKETFSENKHKKSVSFKASNLLKSSLDGVSVTNDGQKQMQFSIDSVFNIKTNSFSNTVNSGSAIIINGKNIRLKDSENGAKAYVMLTSIDSEENIKIYADSLVQNEINKLLLNIPENASGKYTLSITTYFSASSALKNARVIKYIENITVE